MSRNGLKFLKSFPIRSLVPGSSHSSGWPESRSTPPPIFSPPRYDVSAAPGPSGSSLSSRRGALALTGSADSPGATGRNCWFRRLAAAGFLVVLAALLALPLQAQAQTTLVSNLGQAADSSADFNRSAAQRFTTGSNLGGYTLSSVEIKTEDSYSFSMFVCETDGSGFPMATCTSLTAPGSFASGTLVFNAPAGTTLSAGTTYTVVATPGGGTVTLTLDATTAATEDAGGATGWRLADAYDRRDSSNMWQTISPGKSLRVAIKGSAAVTDVVAVPVPRTTDSLQVSWSADNAGTPALTGYDVRYRETDTSNWKTERQDDARSTSLIITGLTSNRYYDVQVRAVTTGSSGPWSSTAEGATSPRPETLFANNPLIPDDLGPGDSFRLLYITGTAGNLLGLMPLTAATGTGIHDYINLVLDPALHIVESGNFMNLWGEISLRQTALVSLPGTDARLLTDTTWTGTDRGVPIYWLNGARVADDYADFYDGTWADEANPVDGLGQPYPLEGPAPWTGTDHDGTELFDGAASRAVGQSTVGVGGLGSSASGAGPLKGGTWFAKTEERPLYGLWHVMVVGENLRLVDNIHVPRILEDEANNRVAVRAQLFTTGPYSSGYGIVEIKVYGTDDDDFLGPVALYTTDVDGDPDLADGLHATLILENNYGSPWKLTAPEGTVLKPSTTYALVFQGESGSYPDLLTIAPDGESHPAEGWSLADALLYHDGTSWVENPDGRSLQMHIVGLRMETEGPALTSATVGAAGNAVTLAFDEDVALPSDSADALTFLASLASVFDLRADGDGVAVSGLTASGTDGLTLGLSGVIVRGQTVTLTYTDPTTGDDAVALQDVLGNESPTFTTGIDGVPDVINNSTINVPGVPRNLVATASGNTRINLSWSAPASNGGFAITGYRIEVSPNGTSNWTELVANTGNPNTTFAHTVAAGTTRHYRVLAINARGSGLPSGVANDTTNEEQTSSVVVPDPPPFSPPVVENPPTEGEVGNSPTEGVEEGCAVSDVTGDDRSLEIFVKCAAERIEDSDTFTETLRILEGFRDDEGNWNDGSTYLVLLTARGGVYFHANDREVEDLDWSGILLCEEGEESVLDTQEGCFIEYEGARMGYAHPFSASHVPLARSEEKFVLLGDFDKIPEEGKPFTGMIGEPSTKAGEVDTDDRLREFVGEAGRVLGEAVSDTEIDPAELRGILRREGPWREGDVYLYIMSEMGRVIFDGAKRDREQKRGSGITKRLSRVEVVHRPWVFFPPPRGKETF